MIVGADQRVRNAFRATLRDEPSATNLVATQELDAADVLEVTDLANAIARAEEVIRARSSSHMIAAAAPSSSGSRDIFDALVEAKADESGVRRMTDDAVGCATYAPYIPTPIPTARTTPVPPPPKLPPPPAMPNVAVNVAAAPATPDRTQQIAMAPILVLDEDAFYHPAGRIRGFADVTIEGYRPEPTLLVRIRERRHALSWIVVGLLLPLVALVVFAVGTDRGFSFTQSAPAIAAPAAKPVQTAPVVVAAPPPPAAVAPAVPVFDVNSLPAAPAKHR